MKETLKYIWKGLIVLILIYIGALIVLFFSLIPSMNPFHGRDGPPECAKGGCEQTIFMDDVGTCFNPYKFDECGGIIPVLYLYVIIIVSVPMLLLLFKPIESILLLLIAFGVGFYLHDKKKIHD